MNLEQAKQEMVKRYKYLYTNSYFILAPYMREQSEEDFNKQVDEYLKKYNDPILKKPLIYLNIGFFDKINYTLEEFLLSDKPMEESKLYHQIENKRNDKEYLDQVKKGLELLEKENADESNEMLKHKLNIWEILGKVSKYIEEQSGDLKNKENKLKVMDEYYRIARYQNDGKIYTSGRKINIHDYDYVIIEKNPSVPLRDKYDIGLKKNSFITAIANAYRYKDNWSIFTESEKQQIYLEYHDELPCDLETACELENEYIPTMIDTRLHRPENTEPCGEKFVIKENEIFVDSDDPLYRYFQICPHCGYIVNVPKEILSEGIKQRIEERCEKDDKLFRKMTLYSELFSLDKKSNEGQKRMLKERK